MTKKILAVSVVVLLMFSTVLLGGCSGKLNMLTGRWKLETSGDGAGQNQQQYPLPVTVDIYPNGEVDMFDSQFGTWKMDRDTFTFQGTGTNKDMKESGSFTINYNNTDSSTGTQKPLLTIILDDQPESFVFSKQADLAGLLAYKKTQTTAPPVVAPAASVAPTATATPAQ